jgi:hypothetical protein
MPLSDSHDLREDHRLMPIKRWTTPSAGASPSPRPASISRSASPAQSRHSFLLTGDLTLMASTCYLPIADGYPYGSILEFDMEPSKPSASPNAQPLGFAACLKPSEIEAPASMDDRQFQLTHPMGQFSRSGPTTNLLDDVAFFPLRKFLPYPKQVIDLTLDDDDDAIEVSQPRMYEVLDIIWG